VTEPLDYIRGDVNSDGKVDIADVIILSKHLVGAADLTPTQRAAANVTQKPDGTIDVTDVLMIVRYLAGFMDSL